MSDTYDVAWDLKSGLFACSCDEAGKADAERWRHEASTLMKGDWQEHGFVSRAISELGGVNIYQDMWFGIQSNDPPMFAQCDRVEDGLALLVVAKHRREAKT